MDRISTIEEYLQAGKKLMPVNGRIPVFKNWTKRKITKENLLTHRGNLGWVLGDGDLVIDIDPRNGGDESFANLLSDLKIDIEPTVITGGIYKECPGKSGKHIYLTIPEKYDGYKFRKVLNKEYPGIDFLTRGSYCIIPPSKTEKQYEWADEIIEGFYQVMAPGVLVDLIAYKPNGTGPANGDNDDLGDFEKMCGGSDWTEERVKEYLNKLDNNLPNSEWVKVGMALYDWHTIEGLPLWEEWSKGGDTYKEGETAKRWPSFDGGGVTLGTLSYMVKEADFDQRETVVNGYLNMIGEADKKDLEFVVIPKLADENFSDIDKTAIVAAIQGRLKELTGGKLAVSKVRAMIEPKKGAGDLTLMKPKWCEDWIYVDSEGGYFNINTYKVCKGESFNLKNGRYLEANEAGGKQTATRYVADNGYVPCATSMAYLPQEKEMLCEFNGYTVINSFNPRTVPSEALEYSDDGLEVIAAFERHVALLFGDDVAGAKLFIEWLAHNIQFPGKKLLWTFVIQSIEGVGKSYIGGVLRACLGGANVGVVSPTQVVSEFNRWATGKCVVMLEEIKISGHNRYDAVNALKPIITDSVIMINDKGITPYETLNTVNPIAFTNYKDALPIEVTDRRFCVNFVDIESLSELEEKVGLPAEAYFNNLFEGLDRCGGELRKWFLEYEISEEFKRMKTAPMTQSKLSMIATEESKFEGLMEIREMLGGDHQYYNETCISSSDLFHDLLMDYGIEVNNSQKHILLKKLNFTATGSAVKINGKTRRVWTRKPMSLDKIKLEFNKTEKDDLEF